MLRKFKIGLPLLALMLGVAASAFTGDVSKKKADALKKTTQTFVYTGTTVEDQDDASLYVLESTNPDVSCSGRAQIICHIDAEPDASGMHPDFSNGDPVTAPENFENITKRQLP